MNRTGIVVAVLMLAWAGGNAQIPETPPNLEDPAVLHAYLAENKARALTLARSAEQAVAQIDHYGYDATFYALDLKIDPDQEMIEGVVVVRGVAKEALQVIKLDFYSNMQVRAVGGQATAFSHRQNVLSVLVPRLTEGQPFEVSVSYQGKPLLAGFASFSFDEHEGTPIVSSLSEPYYARTWWPCKDVPVDKADSARIKLTVPEGMVAASNGTLVSTATADGWTTFHWFSGYPITTYLISVAVTNYRVFDDWYVDSNGDSLWLPYFLYPENYSNGSAALQETKEMMRAFEQYFGPYPFWGEKYGQAQFQWGGGMEHQTCTSLRHFASNLVAHELAHQWWGDMITCRDWQHIWLNEGFASYAEALYEEFRDGREAARQYMNRMAENFDGRIFVDDTLQVRNIFGRIVYSKGAWVLHMLRGVVGDDVFFRILREYGDDPDLKYGTATTEDFQRVAERVSGMDLQQFFHQWIYSPGQPRYLYGWRAESAEDGYRLLLRIKQDQADKTVFHMPIELLVKYAEGSETIRINNELDCQQYSIPIAGQPISVTLDPNDRILKSAMEIPYENLGSDCEYVPLNFQLLPISPNPYVPGEAAGSISIRFKLAQTRRARVSVYNILGQEIVTPLDKITLPGEYKVGWDLRTDAGLPVPAGLYIVTLESGSHAARQKLVIVR